MILLGNKQNSLILLGLFSFSRMEIPVYNLGECTPWGGNSCSSGNLDAMMYQSINTRSLNYSCYDCQEAHHYTALSGNYEMCNHSIISKESAQSVIPEIVTKL